MGQTSDYRHLNLFSNIRSWVLRHRTHCQGSRCSTQDMDTPQLLASFLVLLEVNNYPLVSSGLH